MPDGQLAGLLICADDFGLNLGISEAVIELARLGKIDAASALVESPDHRDAALRLKRHYPRLQIGLHFNLTEAIAEEPISLWKLMCSPRLSRSKQNEITRRLDTQLDLFEEHYAVAPDFIDGHQHVHMLPSVRRLFLARISRRYAGFTPKPWIRIVDPYLTRTDARLKALVLKVFGSGFAKMCVRNGFNTNRYFDGIYSLRPCVRYAALLDGWIKRAAPGTVIMCHPGKGTGTSRLEAARMNEFNVLLNASRKQAAPSTA